jgi:hypothetical protein
MDHREGSFWFAQAISSALKHPPAFSFASRRSDSARVGGTIGGGVGTGAGVVQGFPEIMDHREGSFWYAQVISASVKHCPAFNFATRRADSVCEGEGEGTGAGTGAGAGAVGISGRTGPGGVVTPQGSVVRNQIPEEPQRQIVLSDPHLVSPGLHSPGAAPAPPPKYRETLTVCPAVTFTWYPHWVFPQYRITWKSPGRYWSAMVKTRWPPVTGSRV